MYEIWTSTIQLFRSDPTRSKNEEEKIDSLHPYILHSQSTYKMAYESVYMATHMLDAITLRKKGVHFALLRMAIKYARDWVPAINFADGDFCCDFAFFLICPRLL